MPVYGPKGACPGDLIRCTIRRIRRRSPDAMDKSTRHGTGAATRSYVEASFVEMLAPSPKSVPVPCAHFGNFKLGGGGCGGCSSMHVPYSVQLAHKQNQMDSIFAKLCSIHNIAVDPILACKETMYYRNKMEFSFGRRWYERDAQIGTGLMNGPGEYEYALGLHAPQRFDKIIQISECHIQQPVGNDILQHIRERSADLLLEPHDTKMDEGYLRNVVIRSAENSRGELELMVNFVTSPCEVPERLKPLALEIMGKFPSVICVMQNIRGVNGEHLIAHDQERLLAGSRQYIEQSLCSLRFRISANSFFQTNSKQAEVLYNEVRTAAKLTSSEVVLDLFCGTGTIGLVLASEAKRVVGVDLIASAITDARVNAAENGITNATFEQGNLDKLNTILEASGLPEPDVIVVDPPRAGLHPDLVQYIANSPAKKIVYVSCNPITQERDIFKVQDSKPGKFSLSNIRPVDMFPNTHHMECICVLENIH